jgi:nitrate/nitrite-specific signal transduction histidine kinase
LNATGRAAYEQAPASVEAPDSALTPEALAREHAAVVYRFCAMVCPNRQDAEDLAQEALLRAMRNGHLGLRSMHEQGAGVGGSFEVVSAGGRSTRVVVRVPSQRRAIRTPCQSRSGAT